MEETSHSEGQEQENHALTEMKEELIVEHGLKEEPYLDEFNTVEDISENILAGFHTGNNQIAEDGKRSTAHSQLTPLKQVPVRSGSGQNQNFTFRYIEFCVIPPITRITFHTIIENDSVVITYDREILTDISVPRCQPDIVVRDEIVNMS